jgi:hypothetical protein
MARPVGAAALDGALCRLAADRLGGPVWLQEPGSLAAGRAALVISIRHDDPGAVASQEKNPARCVPDMAGRGRRAGAGRWQRHRCG